MAEANELKKKITKPTGGEQRPRLTKRKAGMARKTKTKKVKLVKKDEIGVSESSICSRRKAQGADCYRSSATSDR